MDQFVITGGKTLSGEIEAGGAKNAAFPLLAASLLTSEECRISNIPLIEDVFRMVEIMESIGVKAEWIEKKTLKIKADEMDPSKIREKLVLLLRGSVLLLGPLLARFGEVSLPKPGGCIIGVRPIDTHLDAFEQVGAKAEVFEKKIRLSLKKKPVKTTVILNEFSVTATENIMLFAALNPGKIIVKTADCDYQVQELARFLKKMGVKIQGIGTHVLTIEGVRKLKGARHKLMYDPIEAGTFILAAAVTRGEILVKNVELPFLEFPLKKIRDFKIPIKIFPQKDNLASVKIFPWKSLKIDKIQSLPYPGIPSDLQSAFGVLATQAKGSTLIHDPLYEGRLRYLEDLTRMGAEIYFADPHRAIINGPTLLYGREIKSADLRGGAALVIAALAARGKTTIGNIYQIDRGYEKIDEKFQKIGADIKRIKN
jgi:UDP-N-acetylglucosamine 1-carboxyvinyltransferase